jgi:hypothetical protein
VNHVTELEATYYSEPINDSFYTFKLTSADHHSGKLAGVSGKGQFLGETLDGWFSWENGVLPYKVNIYFDDHAEVAYLLCDDKKFDRLYGKLKKYPKPVMAPPDFPVGDEIYDIVFNKDKTANTPQPSTNVVSG